MPTRDQVLTAMRERTLAPTVYVRIERCGDYRYAVFDCQCGQTHRHTAGRESDGPVEDFLGHRAAHCIECVRRGPSGGSDVRLLRYPGGYVLRRERETPDHA